jgi:hypothetical protein
MADRPEARIPCPQCGGAIHPVAGKCKHCKADLGALRAGKPQAAAALPKLAASPEPVHPPVVPHDVWARPTNVPVPHAVHVPYAGPPPMSAIDPASVQFSAAGTSRVGHDSEPIQILPPRPTGRMFVVAPAAKWPIVVISISVLAILMSIGALAR